MKSLTILAAGKKRGIPMRRTHFVEPGDAPRLEPSVEYPAPFSGAYSTAPDLFRLARALGSGRILRRETVELVLSPKSEAGNWSYGFDILDQERGLVGHGGSWVGMSNSLDMFTRSGYTAVILSNYTNARSPLREAIWAILSFAPYAHGRRQGPPGPASGSR